MRIILPLAAYILLWWLFRRSGVEWRKATLRSAVLWSVIMTLITELLSAASLITPGWLAVAWLAVCLVEVYLLMRRSSATPRPAAPPVTGALTTVDRVLLALAGVLVASTGALAVLAPPNTWDAMEYHLPRVMMWVSNHNVKLFPTADYAQLVFSPAAEYAMLHLYQLWGGDRLVNLVNFSCFLGMALAASLIAERFGAGPRGQAFAALFTVTIPEALLEASGSMNTAGTAFWIAAAAYFVIAANQEEGWTSTLFAALAVGMALLTKGTAYVYLPLILLACWWTGSAAARLRMLRRLPVIALIVLALNGAQYARAYQFTGSPLGIPFPDGGPRLHWMCDHITPGSVVANVIRNVGLHLETPSGAVNEHVDTALRGLIRGIGQNPDDPNAIWPGLPFITNRRSLQEIYAGNPFHFLVIAIACVLVLLNVGKLGTARIRWYVAGILGSFVFFCGLLRWQLWDARHHLAVFVLFAPIVGLAAERLLSNRWAVVLGALLLLSCAPFVYLNKIRAFIPSSRVVDIYRPRADLYFADQHMAAAAGYEEMAAKVRATGCSDIAVDSYVSIPDAQIQSSPESFFVYPLFALLHVDGQKIRVRYVGVQNLSARYERPGVAVPPCVIACLDCVDHPDAIQRYSRFNPQVLSVGKNEVISFPSEVAHPADSTAANP